MIPAAHEIAQEGSAPAESIESSSPPPDMTSERGSMNPDGSVNLGLRRCEDHHQQQQQPPLQLVPERLLRQNRPSPPLPSGGDLTQYSSNARQYREMMPGSLTDDNRLAPITSLGGATGRQSSLSPASFLSPMRKRSFGETEASSSTDPESNKRLSSIKSILNPAAVGPSSAQRAPSPPSAPSPGTYSTGSPTPSIALPAQCGAEARRLSDESDLSKAERRAALQREANRMREMLAAKERELAEL